MGEVSLGHMDWESGVKVDGKDVKHCLCGTKVVLTRIERKRQLSFDGCGVIVVAWG